MNNHEDWRAEDRQSIEAAEAGMADVLKSFRQSVHAWSDAAFARPRTVSIAVHHWSWRRATGWALGCVLAVGSLSAGIFVHHRQQIRGQEIREQAERLAAAQQRQLAAGKPAVQAQPAATTPDDDAKLMAAVDKDVSQEVPSAMEPLARLMDEGANQ
jgi:hypothetical protein